ncbi:MAG: Mov34/MPN/PAD-1 family protein [Desulfobacteraceae bacterium]|nr:Mov34/MPN/PAD-1 family protein [Desulfobacteraceae bacterium]
MKKVSLDKWTYQKRPIRKQFDGPDGAEVLLRITFNKDAYADIVLHAKEFLEAEVCGVLVGDVCEDDKGLFVCVKASIRGKSAQQDRAHVTFTQETWNAIHKEKDRNYSKQQIVGWYHSHPGFGVEISDMDRFIHENFFSSETQIALVTDPLGGEVAILVNTPEGMRNIDRFWVDTREHRCRLPGKQATESRAGDSLTSGAMLETIERVNTRLSQITQALDDLRNSFFRFLTTVGLIVCLGVVVTIGYYIYSSYKSRLKPPQLLRSYYSIPIQIEDKTVMLGVGVVQWEVPPELNATYLQLEQMKREAEEKAAAEKAAKEKSAASKKDGENSQKVSDESRKPEK